MDFRQQLRMQRAIHNLSFRLVYGSPKRSDIKCCVKIIDEDTKRIKGWSHIAYDHPAIDDEKHISGKPDAEFPRAEKPTSGNPPLQRTNSTKKKETKKTYYYGDSEKSVNEATADLQILTKEETLLSLGMLKSITRIPLVNN